MAIAGFLGTNIISKIALFSKKMYHWLMSYPQAIFLAFVQGITEFLPVSSSGHLVLFQKLFSIENPVIYDVLVHVGTLGAIVVYFRREILTISRKTVLMMIAGTVPAALVGFFLENNITQIFSSARLVGYSFMVTAGLLFSTRWSAFAHDRSKKKQLGFSDALFIGLLQAVAILPGVSRSGATVSAGLLKRLNAKTAFEFSFLLAIPAIGGALILQLPELRSSSPDFIGRGIVGMLVSGVVGFYCLKLLSRLLGSAKIYYFGYYCFLLGLVMLLIF